MSATTTIFAQPSTIDEINLLLKGESTADIGVRSQRGGVFVLEVHIPIDTVSFETIPNTHPMGRLDRDPEIKISPRSVS